jgi:hypothetical protein
MPVDRGQLRAMRLRLLIETKERHQGRLVILVRCDVDLAPATAPVDLQAAPSPT